MSMAIRSTVIRRSLLLLLIAALLLGGLASAYAYRKWQQNREALEQRQIGMQAFDAGDYKTALTSLNAYVKRYTDDLEALDKLAKARLEVVEPQGQHIGQAMSVLRRILYLDAKNPYAQNKLLDLYSLAGMNTEAIQLADDVLKADPNNAAALRAKAISLARLLRFDQALPYAEAYAKEKPLDLEMQTLRFEVAFRVHQSADALIKKAEVLRTEHPGDPRWELLQAYAYRYANDRKNVLHWLKKASSKPPPDDVYVGRLVELLDQVGLYSQAISVLEEAANQGDNAGIKRELIQRLWEHGRHQDVIDRFEREKVDVDRADANLIALAARSHYTLKQPAAAQRLIRALAARKRDAKAQAWAGVLTALYGAKQPSAIHVIEQCKAALLQDPRNAFFEAILGAAYRQLGETELAIEHWRQATALRPVWGAPHLQLARMALANGRANEALLHAQRAVTLMPGRIEAAVIWALARNANARRLGSDSPAKLLAFVKQINRAAPDEQRLLPLEVALLAQTGARDKASGKLAEFLKRKKPLKQASLQQLAKVSRQYALGLEKQYEKKIATVYGASPDKVLAEALRIASEKTPAKARQWLDETIRTRHSAKALAWRVVDARFLDATGDPQANDAWATLVKDEGDNLKILRQALQSQSVQADKQFAMHVIDLLRKLVGDDGTAWRLERARWLLLHADSEQDMADATSILEKLLAETPSLLEARLLLARSLLHMGVTQRAIRELTVVADARPDSIPITLELARDHQLQGNFDQVRNLLDRVLKNRAATPANRFRVAQMLASQGDPRDDARAVTILKSLDGSPSAIADNRRLLLAQLYVRQDDQANAEQICKSLFEHPSLQAVQFLIAYYAERGKGDEVDHALNVLDTLDLPPGTREMVRGDYFQRTDQGEAALQAYQQAVKQAPQNADAWYRVIAYSIGQGLGDQALRVAADAEKAVEDKERFAFFRSQATRVQQFASSGGMRDFVLALISANPRQRKAAADVLRVGAEALRGNLSTADTAVKLRPLADQYPRFLPLQIFVGRADLSSGRLDDAVAIALRGMRNFPQSPEPAWLATESLARAGRWDESISVARQWRHRERRNPLDADLMIAEAEIRLGKARLAAEKIKPYLKEALAHTDQYAQVIERYARALIADDKTDQAGHLLTKQLHRSAAWRGLWMQLAAVAIKDPRVGAQWLHQVESSVPPTAKAERIRLAESWYLLSTRSHDHAFAEKSRALLAPVAHQADVPPGVNLLLGMIANDQGDLPSAAKYYRAELRSDKTNGVAMNNLAMTIVQLGGDLKEALALATEASRLFPQRANFLDTLAQVQAKRHAFDQAIESMKKAIALEPGEPKWEVRLREIQKAASGKAAT